MNHSLTEARSRLQELSNELFEELSADIYDEVDRRETDASEYYNTHTLSLHSHTHTLSLCSHTHTHKHTHTHIHSLSPLTHPRTHTHTVWLTTQQLQSSVAFLPVNPTLSPLRNQSRQKLAILNSAEFTQLLVDILLDAKRRQQISMETGKIIGNLL